MKKLYSGITAALLVLGLAACGPTTPAVDENKVLADASVDGYCLLGDATTKIGDDFIKAWGDFDGTNAVMTATSIANVRKADAKLADTLVKNNPVALYSIEGAKVATDAIAGWEYTWGDEATKVNGAYAIKTGSYAIDAENGKSAVATWIPSKESGKTISLTPDTYWITSNFAEEKDENGYDWNANPAIISGAGTYTIVLAKFAKPVDGASYGIGAIKTAEGTEFVPEVTAEFKNWKITGTPNEWNTNKSADIDNFSADGKLTYTFEANAEFKVTQLKDDDTGDWNGAIGAKATTVAEGLADAFDLTGDNIKVITAGTYDLTVTGEGADAKLAIAAHAEA